MKLNLSLSVVAVLLSSAAFAGKNQTNIIYGEDNRVEAYERPELLTESRAVAAMVSRNKLNIETLIGFEIDAPTYQQDYNLCRDQRFVDQPVISECTGFLVGPDILMTAGHCVTNMKDCQGSDWVFDFEMSEKEGNPTGINRNNVYQCKSILAQSAGNKIDFAIIQLDRPTDRTPLNLAGPSAAVAPGTNLYMMGYPGGLPLKITDNAQVLKQDHHLLVTNIDAFEGNSGSPVLDAATHLVIGILVSGNEDFFKTRRGCSVVNQMEMSRGGEKVTSLSFVPRGFLVP